MTTDPRIDAYIDKQADFARPILEHVRAAVHEACPEVEETIKWSMPTFVYGGGILCGMAAFKQHAVVRLLEARARRGRGRTARRHGQLRQVDRAQGPAAEEDAARAHPQGDAVEPREDAAARKAAAPKPPPEMPADLAAALKKNAKARKAL